MGRYSNSKQAHGTSGSPQLSLGQGGLASKVGELYDKLMSDNNYKVSETDQTKHIKGSSNYNPNKSEFYKEFFSFWEKFEIKYGNVETYQEMENIKKNIASKYSLNVAVFNSKN